MADLARNASFPEEEFERERRQKLEELRDRAHHARVSRQRAIARECFSASIPTPIIAPTEEQVAAYRREQLEEFYRQHYVPSDALLIVVGDFATDAMFEQSRESFRRLEGSAACGAASARASAPVRPARALVHLPGTVQTQVLLGNIAITRRDPDWYRLMLANSIYGGAFHSRLVMNIREQKGYTYSPRSGVNALRQQGYFTVRAAVRNEVVAATLTEMFYEMDRMRSAAGYRGGTG